MGANLRLATVAILAACVASPRAERMAIQAGDGSIEPVFAMVVNGDSDDHFIQAADLFAAKAKDRHLTVCRVPTPCPGGDVDFFRAKADSNGALRSGPMGASTLLFYLGHGIPRHWNTIDSGVDLNQVQVGDSIANAQEQGLRYFWQCSCQVFAHGPPCDRPGYSDYACPDLFGSNASGQLNIFKDLSKQLGTNLRMACGSSTSLNCWEQDAEKIWEDFGPEGREYDVADSFVNGMRSDSTVVPVCLARGEKDPQKSPLYDRDFFKKANDFQGTHFHLEYPLPIPAGPTPPPLPDPFRTDVKAALSSLLAARVDALLEPALPPPVRAVGQDCPKIVPSDERTIVCTRLAEPSGPVPLPEERPPDMDPFLRAARKFVADHGWCLVDSNCQKPTAYRLLVDSVPVGELESTPERRQKGVIVTFKRLAVRPFNIGGNSVEVVELGKDGTIEVYLNNEAQVVSVSRTWPPTVFSSPEGSVMGYDAARAVAKSRLPDGGTNYERVSETWGYMARIPRQPAEITFVFKFVPKPGVSALVFPPRRIEVPISGN